MKCIGSWCSIISMVSLLFAASSARAQTAPPTTDSASRDGASPSTNLAGPPTPPSAKPPPYSLPWQLRPVVAGNVIRSDTAFAFYKPPTGESANTVASMLLASVKLTNELAPLVRLGVVRAELPNGQNATNLINPVLGATYAPKLGPNYRLGLFLGVAFPVGGGGGENPSPNNAAANAAGIAARSAMDNAMFAVNYFTVFPGVGFAYTASGFTAQAEVTLLQLTHARGPDSEDRSRTNLTTGIHLGYFLIPAISLGAELRHQRWISTPSMVKSNAAARDTSTVAVGPRFHFQLGDGVWLRPGVALILPLDAPMSLSDYKIVQLDVPVAF